MRLSKKKEEYIRTHVGLQSDSEIARTLGLGVEVIARRRRSMQILPFNYHYWGREQADEICAFIHAGLSSERIAEHYHIRLSTLRAALCILRNRGFDVPRLYIPKVSDSDRQRRRLTDSQLAYLYSHLGKQVDREIADHLGIHQSIVGYYRRKVGIKAYMRPVWTDDFIRLIRELWLTYHSKQVIAQRLGISVTTLQSRVSSFRKQGYDIPFFYEPSKRAQAPKQCTD